MPEDLKSDDGLADNPYTSPLTETSSEDGPIDVNQSPQAEDVILRAWRAAIIGLVIFPILAQLYSICLLLSISADVPAVSEQAKNRYWGALIIDLLVLGGTVMYLVNSL